MVESNRCSRRCQALAERGEAFMGKVFIQVQRIELAEMFGGDMHLFFEEGADGGIAFAHGKTRHFLLRGGFLQQQTVQAAVSRIGPARRSKPRGRKCRCMRAPAWPGVRSE